MSLIVKKNPVGIDWHIRKLQEKIYDKLTAKWGDSVTYDCYGRVDRLKTDDGYKAARYKSKNEYGEVYFDDAAHDVVSFFGVSQSSEIEEESIVNVHLVFFANVGFKSSTKRTDEEIRKDVYDILQKDPYGFRLDGQVTGLESCLAEYPGSLRDDRLKFFDTHPKHIFRFNLVKRYDLGSEYLATEAEDVDESTLPSELPSGGGTVSQTGSTGGTEQEAEGLYWSINMSDVGNSTIILFVNKPASVDWGDGSPVMNYAGNSLITKSYTDQTTVEAKVYWGSGSLNKMNVIYLVRDSGDVTYTITGDFPTGPTGLSQLSCYGGLQAIPENLPTAALRAVDLRRCSLTADALNTLGASLVAAGLQRGTYDTRTQTTGETLSDQTVIAALDSLGWNLYY